MVRLRAAAPTARVELSVAEAVPAPLPVELTHAVLRVGYGSVGMRERVEALGGVPPAGPGEQGGWVVRANLPVVVESASLLKDDGQAVPPWISNTVTGARD